MILHDVSITRNGLDIQGFVVRFSDGTKLRVITEVKLPPLEEMTPRVVETWEPTVDGMPATDNGLGEAWELSEKSDAVKLLRYFETILNDYYKA